MIAFHTEPNTARPAQPDQLSAPPIVELPTDRPRHTPPYTPHARVSFTLPAALVAALEAVAIWTAVPAATIVLAGFKAVLYRYTGQADLMVSARIEAGQPGARRLAVRSDLGAGPTLEQLLERVQAAVRAAEQLASPAPHAQLMFDFGAAEPADPAAETELQLCLRPSGAALDGTLVYSSALYDAATITRLAGHLTQLLAELCADLDLSLERVPLLSAAEREQLVHAWNDTGSDYPRQSSIAALFEAQAARTPDAIALVFGAETISYAELNRRANQLAHHLRALGVTAEALVGVAMERSPELIVALLAVLKAGGAYLPLDPHYPRERLQMMLEDAQVGVLLSQRALQQRLPAYDAALICLDEDQADWAQQPGDNLPALADADSLAYVIYTSGSTGRPKGVSVPQRGVVRLVTGADYARFGADEVFLQLAPVSFDASTFEVWGALLNGARLVIFPPQIPTLEELARTLEQQQITTLWLTAGLFHQMVREQPRALRGLRQLLAGGDVLQPPQVLQVLRDLRPGAALINGYGPTENTTFTTCHPLRDAAQVGHSVAIGRPIANTEVYVLDARMQPVPIGVPGELYTGGDGLARGYLNRPALTAEKFVPNPFGDPGSRLYRTGDLVRWLPDGTIEFFGRRDQQVKIRGFRIELGEIEAALQQHPAVHEAIVIPREDVPPTGGHPDKRLVAYVVGTEPSAEKGEPGSGTASSQQLRAFLAERLPAYMLPSAVVVLPELPLNANGKVDRRALPAPQLGPADDEPFTAPSTPTEQRLAELWTRLLGVARVGREANFFALGGHSLLATQLASAIRSSFAVELPLSSLFDAPTLSALAETIDARGQGLSLPPIVARDSGGDQPLSFAQQRLWFLNQWQPDSPLYNIVVANRLRGALDLAVLQRSLEQIVARHEALRTTFPLAGAEAVQRIAAEQPIALTLIDLSDLAPAEREDMARDYMQIESKQPFDLAQGPLLRAVAIRIDADEHIFILSMHHIISDGWSMQVLLRELFTLYEAHTQDAEASLTPLPVQYADYAAWQQRWMQGQALDEQLGYWQRALAGAPTLLELPTDRPRPATQSFRGAQAAFALSPALSDELRALTQRAGVTPFMTLLAAWATLLARYSGQHELIIGVPIASRTRAEVEQVVGMFVNTLALRIDLRGDPSFTELLRRVRDTALRAYVYQDLPFERLVTALHPERNLSHNPLFQVMFAFQNDDFTELKLPRLTVSPIQLDPQTAMFDLTLDLIDSAQGMRASLEYSTDLFDEPTIERLISHFQTLLAGIVAAPETSVARLPLLPAAERSALLRQRHGEPVDVASERRIHVLFEQQAARTPEAVALVCGAETISYAELNQRANQLAHTLIARGVRPETMVGIAVERSIEMVVGLLGVLKAGGAYVPLDPSYPQQRLAYILGDAQVPLLLTTRAVQPKLAEYAGDLLYLDADWPLIARQPASDPQTAVGADSLMYVIYTSGSTGRPKGVMLEHHNAANHFRWMQQRFPLAADDAVLQQTSFSFDVSVWEIFAPLLQGVRLVLPAPEGEKDPAYLARLIAEQRVTTLQLVPSLLRMLLEQPGFTRCDALRRIFCGGEAMPLDLPAQLAARSGATLINMYGPTETTIDAAYWVCPRDGTLGKIPIGYPVGNATAYVLDPHGQLQPLGVPGELSIGGAGVARGYLNRPALTAATFVADPFTPGARMYRTGDLVRWLPDGTIEFLGRIDQQVKVRGFRIELGEIEAALLQHPAVHEAIVVARPYALDSRLIAYVVPGAGATNGGRGARPLVPGELRAYLAQSLPEYMLPSAFIALPELPLSPNGKIDRAALPAPETAAIETGAAYVAPRSATETTLAMLWASVVGSARVGIHDNFFELGGNSLLATRIVAQVRETLRVEIPLRALFEAPTIAALAQQIDALTIAEPQPDDPIDSIDAELAQELLADFTDLSDAEVERLLSTILSEEEVTSYE